MQITHSVRSASQRFFTGIFTLLLLSFSLQANADDVTWDGGTTGVNTAWRTVANWDPDGVPTTADNAIFGSAGTVAICGIDMTAASGLQEVGSITIGSGRSTGLTIRNSSTTTAGVLALHGVNGVLLSNESAISLTLTNGTSQLMGIRLAASGDVFVAGQHQGAGALITVWNSISETGGPRSITKQGGGILYLRGTNSYSGSTTLNLGALKVDGTGTFGSGDGAVIFNGGDMICGADRSGGTPLRNAIVFNTDGFIYNDGGTAGTSRTLPLSGPLSGTAGTLGIANLTGAGNNTFQVRLLGGGFDFTRPILVGAPFDTATSFSVLQLYNPATNGVQTFSGDISGQGIVRRQGSTASSGGTTVFTGNNTYSGGTLISYGTLLANNVAGSGLGSGQVTVTNLGVVGGSGTIGAAVSLILGGTIAPGASSNVIGNINVQDLTFDLGAKYLWQISSATGTPGTAWDLINVTGTWTDAASSLEPITIKLDTLGVVPTGWNAGVAREWIIVQGVPAGFDASHFVIDTTGFAAPISGIFSLNVVGNSLRLNYAPAPDVVLNVPSGTQTQAQLGYPSLSGAVGVIKTGDGEAIFDNPANDYAGSTKIYAGTASAAVDALNNSGAFGNASTPILVGNTIGNSNATLNINTAGVTISRSVTVQAGSSGVKTIGTTIASGVATFAGDVTLQDNVVLRANSGGTAMISGLIDGTNDVTKTGAGVVALSAANNYSGKTKILEGVLSIDAVGRLGSIPINLVEDQITIDGGTLEFTASTASSAATRGFLLGSGDATFNVTGGTLTLNGPVSGLGDLIKTGASILELNHGTNTYSGDTFFNAGEIRVDGDGMFGDGTGALRWNGGDLAITANRSTLGPTFIRNPIVMAGNTILRSSGGTANTSRIAVFSGDSITTTAGTLTISNSATAGTNTFDVRVVGGGFNFSRPIELDSGTGIGGASQLFLGNSNASPAQTFSGVISGNGRIRRSANVTSDAGVSILTGANTYSGGTVVAAGTLLVNNTTGSGTGSGSVIVTNVGTLGGTGTISGDVSGNGTVAPGSEGVGALTLQNGLDQSNGGTFAWELATNTVTGSGVNFDQLVLSGGNLILGGTSKLQLVFSGSASAPDTSVAFWQTAHSWRIVSLSGGSNPGNAVFASILNGSYAAGNFSTAADANGILLNYTPNATTPQPTISSSLLGAGTANVTLSWSAQNGVNYEVQYKTNLNQPTWLFLGNVTATGSTASFNDTTGPSTERYYRLLAQ